MSHYLAPVEYLPHDEPMLLLEKVIDVQEDSTRCQVSVSRESVLAPFLDQQGNLPGWYALELMAQTVGVWSGWHSHQRGEQKIALGMVLGARELICSEGYLPNGAVLDIDVKLLMRDDRFGSFECAIYRGDKCLATGRVNTFQPTLNELTSLFNQGSTV